MGTLVRASWQFIRDHLCEPIVLKSGAICRHCARPMSAEHVVLPFRKSA